MINKEDIFDLTFGIVPENDAETTHRTAVRAVVYHNDRLLMIKTNRHDYKFPGGGVQCNETLSEAVIREVMEETGYRVIALKDMLGVATQRNLDQYDATRHFEMISYYFLCEIDPLDISLQDLDDYEKMQEFEPVFILPEEAYQSNVKLLLSDKNTINPWVERETAVLDCLLKRR